MTRWSVSTNPPRLKDAGWFGLSSERDFASDRLSVEQKVQWAKDNPAITSFVLAPDGSWVVALGLDATLALWRLEPGKAPTLAGKVANVVTEPSGLAAAPDGAHVLVLGTPDPASARASDATGLSDAPEGMLGYWRIDPSASVPLTRSAVQLLPERPAAASFSPDGKYVAVVGWSESLSIVEVADGNRLVVHEQPRMRHTSENVDWSAHGNTVLTGGFGGELELWSVELDAKPSLEKQRNFRHHSDKVRDLAVAPDGRWFVSNSPDKTLAIWPLSSDVLDKGVAPVVFTANAADYSYGVAIHPTAPIIAVGGDTISLWTVNRGLLAAGQISPDAPSTALPKVDFTTAMRRFCNAANEIDSSLTDPGSRAAAMASYVEDNIDNRRFEELMNTVAESPPDARNAVMDAALKEVGLKSCPTMEPFRPAPPTP